MQDETSQNAIDAPSISTLYTKRIVKIFRSLFYPHVVFIIVSIVLLFIPTPLNFLKEFNLPANDETIESTPFVVLPEPGTDMLETVTILVF